MILRKVYGLLKTGCLMKIFYFRPHERQQYVRELIHVSHHHSVFAEMYNFDKLCYTV